MRNQYKEILDAHTAFLALANGAVQAAETELSHTSKRERHYKNELDAVREQSSRVATGAALEECEKQLKEVSEDLQATQVSEAAAIKHRDQLEEELQTAYRAADEREAAYAEARQIVRNYEAKIKELNGGDADLAADLDKERKNAKALQQSNNKMYDELDSARTEVAQIKQDAKRHDRQIAKTVMELQDMRKLKDDLAAQLDAAKLEAEEHRTALEEYKALPQAAPQGTADLEEAMHRAGELIIQAVKEDDVDKSMRYLERALSKLGRPKPQGASA